MAKFKYWLPEHGMTRDDAFEFDTICRHPRDVAGDAAKDYHYSHEGWESRSWPIHIIIQMQNGAEHSFEIERDMEPVFFATERSAPTQSGDSDA